MFSIRKHLVISFLCAMLGWTLPATSGEIFTDDFDSGASTLWGNETGEWAASGGVYDASSPGNFPATYSSLPFELTDFVFEVDVREVLDGGIWLRSTYDGTSSVGVTGVLLVTGAAPTSLADRGTQLFWHIVTGDTYGGILEVTLPIFDRGSDITIRVEVTGNTYSAFLNDGLVPVTTLVTDMFSSGQVALYDFTTFNQGSFLALNQTFDNVRLSVADAAAVPEPPTIAMFLLGLIGLGFMARRRQLKIACINRTQNKRSFEAAPGRLPRPWA